MRIKSQEALIDFIDEKSQIRRRELITLTQLLQIKRKHELNIACRSAIVIAYAHWEGFVKETATAYVEYVACRALKFEQLSPNFKAIACREILSDASRATKRMHPHIRVVEYFMNQSSKIIDTSCMSASVIDTQSNLKSEVFENICITIGLDYTQRWSTYGPFIDELATQRHLIAHGTIVAPPKDYAVEAVDFVEKAIDWFRTDIENCAVLSAFVST